MHRILSVPTPPKQPVFQVAFSDHFLGQAPEVCTFASHSALTYIEEDTPRRKTGMLDTG